MGRGEGGTPPPSSDSLAGRGRTSAPNNGWRAGKGPRGRVCTKGQRGRRTLKLAAGRSLDAHEGRGGLLYGGHFAGEYFGGGDFATIGFPKLPAGLTHTLTCKPMLRFRGRKMCKMATESSISSQHLKESATPKHLPEVCGPTNAIAIGIFIALSTPRHGKSTPPSSETLNTKSPHEVIPTRNFPSHWTLIHAP